MHLGAKLLKVLFLPAVFSVLILSSCENDLKKIKEIASRDLSKSIDSTKGVDMIFSDSAVVKAHMFAPLLLQATGKNTYSEMPKGVRIIFYDKNFNQISTITSEYAIQRDQERVIELRKNVVAVNQKGEQFKSDELIWDENSKMMHSNKPVQIITATGDVMNGTTFTSDQSLNHWSMTQSTGTFNVNSSPAQ